MAVGKLLAQDIGMLLEMRLEGGFWRAGIDQHRELVYGRTKAVMAQCHCVLFDVREKRVVHWMWPLSRDGDHA